MATPFDLNKIAQDKQFQRRVEYYMTKGAIAVLAEAPATLGNSERSDYADTVVTGIASVFDHGLAATTNATVAAAGNISTSPETGGFGISDSDLEFSVNEMWNAMSKFDSGT